MIADTLNDNFVDSPSTLECDVNALGASDASSDTGSEISISEKILLESNEKRLRQRMSSLQNSILNLKEQLKLEKELWREDMEKIRTLQQQQQEIKCTCPVHQTKSKDTIKCENINSNYSLGYGELNSSHTPKKHEEVLRTQSIKQLLELQNYKRKLAETENMCTLELTRVKQSLEDLKTLQNIACEWGKTANEDKEGGKMSETDPIQEIFVNLTSKTE